jgi:hypothetical protein
MKSLQNKKGILLILAMILIAAFSRLIPHPSNFTAIGAMTLFGSAYNSKKYLAFLAPLVAMWLSDLAINNVIYAEYNNGFVWFQSFQLYTFLSIALIAILGFVLFKKVSAKNIAIGSLLAPTLFFIVSNFGSWMSPMALFPKTFDGLIQTYVAGIPFYRNNIMGTIVFSTVMFGVYYLLTQKFPKLSLKDNKTVVLTDESQILILN